MAWKWRDNVKELLCSGGSVNSYIKNYTPLLCAIQCTDIMYVQKLIALGADVNLPARNGLTPLYMSMGVPWTMGMTQRLVKAGADVNREYVTGDTPLIQALGSHATLQAKLYLEHGAHVNQISSNGETALYVATSEGLNCLVEALLEHAADPNIMANTETFGEDYPLHCALASGFCDIAVTLLEANANINAVAAEGTPLVISARNGLPLMTQRLLRMNALVNVVEDTTINGYHAEVCVPPCYVLLYIAGEEMNYFNSCDFLGEFLDLKCEWFLRKVLLPTDVSKQWVQRFIRNYVYLEPGEEIYPRVQSVADQERSLQFIEHIYDKNFTLQASARRWVRKYMIASKPSDNLFRKVRQLVDESHISYIVGKYLLFDHELTDDIMEIPYRK